MILADKFAVIKFLTDVTECKIIIFDTQIFTNYLFQLGDLTVEVDIILK